MRQHKIALIALAVFHFTFFFPVLFMGRVVSPNDVFFNFDPWAIQAHTPVQNSLINDPPTAYFTLMSMAKSDWGTFHWNPYIACGIPGFGSSAAAMLSPFILLPTLTVPLTWVYTLIIFLKLNVAFFFAYLWLREEGLGEGAAAIGAIVIAGSGIYAVRWLWQSTNATALYPALLWIVRRMWNGRAVPIWLVTPIALAYALAGFPAAMAYGAYIAVAYVLFLAIRERRFPARTVANVLIGSLIALAIASPSLVPFARFVKRTGYLAVREQASFQLFLPLSHARSFLDPERLGNNALKNWSGDPKLGTLNNYVESTIYLGLAAFPLALLALFNRGARARWFWLAAALVILGCMFGIGGFPALIGRLPGFKYSSLARTSMLLPLAAGYLAAAGAAWLGARVRMTIAAALLPLLAVAAAFDLGMFAGRFYPYLEPSQAVIRPTPTIAFLQSQNGPFRVAPTFTYLWPNVSELFRLEDIRSHFSSEEAYRRLLRRVDPTSWGGASTIIQFNSLKLDFADPIISMLGVRYYVEQKSIDIIKWTTFANTEPGVKESGAFRLEPGMTAQRTITVSQEPFYAIELPVSVDEVSGRRPYLTATLMKFGQVIWQRDFAPDDMILTKVYIPLRPYARLGETVTLTVKPVAMTASLLGATDGAFFFGRVMTPVVFERELPDGRLFRNLGEVPRFHPVTSVRALTFDQLLADKSIDFGTEAIVTDGSAVPPTSGGASVSLKEYAAARQRLATDAPSPFFLASSEKLTPELRVTIDGNEAGPVGINGLFAGVAVPAGQHEVVFTRNLARGWWWLALAALAALLISAALRR
ncbi:MAG: rane protein of unknown function [Acidobacteria bacterium]|nr:rane protein of unknown function [Acidobacteriota bacterium]